MDGRGAACKGHKTCAPRGFADDPSMARRLSIDEGVDLYLAPLKVERGLARPTLDAYGRDLARFAGFLVSRGRADVDDIPPADVADHLLALADQRLAARSRARAL